MNNNFSRKIDDHEPHFSFDKNTNEGKPITDEEFVQSIIDLMVSDGMSNGEIIDRLVKNIEVTPEHLKPIVERKINELKSKI
jgi:hypothetical protein